MLGRSKDLRKSSRRNLKATGWVRLGGFAVRQCEVVDLSDSGAKITVSAQQSLPNSFSFALDRGHEGRVARVKWRKGTEIGLEFVKASEGDA